MEALGLEPRRPGRRLAAALRHRGRHQPQPRGGDRSRKGGEKVDLKYQDDYIAFSGVDDRRGAASTDAEIVFVGYGIVAPEYGWDDYKGADLKGKVLLMMNNDPEDDPQLFAGKTRLYYGRWDYKYEQAARQGAAGAIIIHTEPSAGYKWQVVQTLVDGRAVRAAVRGRAAGPGPGLGDRGGLAAHRHAWAGRTSTRCAPPPQKQDFKPVPLGVTLSRRPAQRRPARSRPRT